MGYAFISYSSKNQEYADAIRELFNKNLIDTWMAPYDIPAGSVYAAEITKAIRECNCFVLILSNDSQESVAVNKEVELAALTFKKTIVSVEIEDVVLNDAFTFYVHNTHIIAVHKIDENLSETKQLIDAVKAHTGKRVIAPSGIMRTVQEWYDTLVELTRGTDYGVIIKTDICSPVVAIVPKGGYTPQRIAIYPKKTQNAGLVFEYDVFQIPRVKELMGEPTRIKSNRPHYYDIPDQIILEVCTAFLTKD